MYTQHFKMHTMPFCERAPVDLILKDARIQQGLARLNYMAQQGTLALVTGPTGVGKSTLIKLFLNSLAPNRYSPVYLNFTNVKTSSMLKMISTALGEPPRITKEKVFAQIVEKVQKSELEHILIIDEAHLVNSEALTDIRLLVSSAIDDTPPLKILLVGQDALKNQLKRSQLQDLLQRINVRYQMRPLTCDETSCYIDFQIKASGSTKKIFDSNVKNAIFQYTHGIHRQINNLATACLINAAALNLNKIDEQLFNQTMSEFQAI